MADQANVVLITILTLAVACSAVASREGGASTSATGEATPIAETWTQPRPVSRLLAKSDGVSQGDPFSSYISVNDDPEGDMPRELVFTPDGTEVVVVHRDTDNVTFFDVETRVATHTVDVGDFPVDVEVTPDGRYVVVPNLFGDSVSLVDIATHTLAATIPVTGEQPFRIAVSADSNFAVVGVINDGVASSFSVIDLHTHYEIRSFPSGPQGLFGFFFSSEGGISGGLYTQFALTPDGGTIVLPDISNNRVRLYDPATGVQTADLPTAEQPTALDISLDGTRAVVSHEGAAKAITEVDLITRTIVGTSSVSEYLSGQVIRITPDKTHAIAAISNNVIFVKLSTGATTATLSTGSVGDIEISYDGLYAFISNYNSSVIKISGQSIVKTLSLAPCVDAVTSPVEHRAVALNNRFREDIHFYDISGSAGFVEGFASSGEPAEGDAASAVDVSADGSLAVVCNVVSRNVSIVDLTANTVRSYVEVGDRPKEVRITPDGKHAVVCAMDANAVVVIDLTTDTVVKTLMIYNRPGRVRISPDGMYAYVLNVAGSDRISFIRLDGADSYIISQESAGQTGSALGYTYSETSGIELSIDGSLLAVCDSFNDLLRLFDTVTRTQIAAVGVGDFPIRAQFSPDGNRVYVSNAFSDNVSVVENEGGSWSNIKTIHNIDMPLTIDCDSAGSYVYVGNVGSSAGLRVIDAEALSVVKMIPFPQGSPRDSYLSSTDSIIYAISTSSVSGVPSELVRVAAAGTTSAIIDNTPISSSPADMAFCELVKKAVAAQPIPDGVDVVAFAGKPGDVNGDGVVDVLDLLEVLGAWGDCVGCPADLDGNGVVDVLDLLIVLGNWG